MAQVCVTVRAAHLDAMHPVAVIFPCFDLPGRDYIAETGPAAVGIEFGGRVKQFVTAHDAVVSPPFEVIPELARKGTLGPRLLGYVPGEVADAFAHFVFAAHVRILARWPVARANAPPPAARVK